MHLCKPVCGTLLVVGRGNHQRFGVNCAVNHWWQSKTEWRKKSWCQNPKILLGRAASAAKMVAAAATGAAWSWERCEKWKRLAG
jgi:hypothetical protein